MNTNIINNAKVFAKEFVSAIIEGNTAAQSGYEMEISAYNDCDQDFEETTIKATLALYDGEGEEVGAFAYEIIRDRREKYSYSSSFCSDDIIVNDSEEGAEEFSQLQNAINECSEGLYDKICAYLHKFAMNQLNLGEDVDATNPPGFEV